MEIGSGPDIDQPAQPSANFEVSATELVSRTITVYFRKFGAYLILVGIPSLVMGLVGLFVFLLLFGDLAYLLYPGLAGLDPFSLLANMLGFLGPGGSAISLALILGIINTIVLAILNGAGVKYAMEDYGDPGSGDMSDSFSFAMGRAVTLIVANLIVSLVLFAIMSPVILLTIGGLFSVDPLDPYAYLTMLSMLMPVLLICFVIVFFVSIRLTVTPGVVIAEDVSAVEAVKRAWELTGGAFWHVLGGSFLLGIVVVILGMILGMFSIAFVLTAPALSFLIPTFLAIVITGPITNVFQAVLYKDLASRVGTKAEEWW